MSVSVSSVGVVKTKPSTWQNLMCPINVTRPNFCESLKLFSDVAARFFKGIDIYKLVGRYWVGSILININHAMVTIEA